MTDKIAQNFAKFHQSNPHVYELFDRFTRQMMASSAVGSAKLIFERLRWELMLRTDTEAPKLNNNYTALYAREWEKRNPARKGFFKKRVRRKHTTDSTEFDEAAE